MLQYIQMHLNYQKGYSSLSAEIRLLSEKWRNMVQIYHEQIKSEFTKLTGEKSLVFSAGNLFKVKSD